MIPWTLIDELLERLLVATGETRSQRLDRLAFTVKQEATEVHLAPVATFRTAELFFKELDEGGKLAFDGFELWQLHIYRQRRQKLR